MNSEENSPKPPRLTLEEWSLIASVFQGHVIATKVQDYIRQIRKLN